MILFQVGYVQLDDPDSVEIVTKYDVAPDANSMLIFQENTRLPVVQVSMKDLPLATLLDVLESHQFLQLPRLSSQEVFDHLCPPGNFRVFKATAAKKNGLAITFVIAFFPITSKSHWKSYAIGWVPDSYEVKLY